MRKVVSVLCIAGVSLALGQGEKKISLFTAMDFGRVEAGSDLRNNNYDASGTALSRTYVDVGYVERLDEHYLISIGVGGIFWKSFTAGGGTADEKAIKFGPGISNAYMQWSPTGNIDVTFGFFPYKYNAAANNLGEYLFRTEAYPTVVYTGGWNWVNGANYSAVGVKLTHRALDGKLRQDVGLFGEYFNSPIYDITPAYIATFKPNEWLTVGGAGSLHRFITPTPGTRRELTRSYAYRDNFYLPEVLSQTRYNVNIAGYQGTPGYTVSYSGPSANVDSIKNVIWANEQSLIQASDPSITSASQIPLVEVVSQRQLGRAGEYVTMLESDIIEQAQEEGSDSATYFGDPNNASNTSKSVSFDLKAIKLLAFFEVDFNKILGWNEADMGKFNLYGEIAQLGLKNYPIFYTEMEQRRPMMVGFSVPTFGVLNSLSLETEYLKNPNVESIASTYDNFDLPPDPNFRYQTFSRDDWKWSVHAHKKLSSFLSLYVQVANDHMRLKNGFTQPQYVPMTNEPGHWYWLTRIQWMI